MPANWLQGLEGGIDSVHAPILHRSVIEAMLEERGAVLGHRGCPGDLRRTTHATKPRRTRSACGRRRCAPPTKTAPTSACAHYFFPFVVVVPNGYASAIHVFCFAPVDDTHHLVFFGNYGETPLSLRDVSGALTANCPIAATSPRCAAIARTGGARTGSS